MEFDERLRHALGALADSLHQEISARLDAVRTDLSESVHADREAAIAEAVQQVGTAADQSIREARAAADQAVQDARSATDRTVQEVRAASEQAAHEARIVADQELSARIDDAVARAGTKVRAEAAANLAAANGRLVEAIRAIDSAQTLSTIFDVLVSAATAEVGRAAVFLLEGANLKGWRLVGFDLLGGDGAGIEVPIADGGMIAEAAESAHAVRLDPAAPSATQPPAFADLASSSMALAVPLMMSGQVFGVLYADEGTRESVSRESWPAAIEVLARHAARTLEAVTVTKLAQVAEVVAR
jgi:hypothetical protein